MCQPLETVEPKLILYKMQPDRATLLVIPFLKVLLLSNQYQHALKYVFYNTFCITPIHP